MGRVLVGCTSWSYDDWVGSFYPAGTPPEEKLPRYAKVFPLVEADSTFYRMPSPSVTARWAADTPEGFLFTAKLPRRITHEAKMVGCEGMLQAFLERIDPLRKAGKLAALLAQFPASFTREKGEAALGPFLELVPKGVRLAFEFRSASWHAPSVYDTLRARGAALAWMVMAEPFTPPEVTSDFLYCRLVGPDREFDRHDKLQRDLHAPMEKLRDRLAQEGAQAKEAFMLASNHFEGHGPATAQRMMALLGQPCDLGAAKATGPKGQRSLGDF